jgi:Leucine-rich repeat (LRR) protein
MYRLPTEAEWEYACRAGTTTQFSFSFGDDRAHLDQYGWYQGNAGGRSHPVGTKLPNPFGLFDMHGNANEWCQDWHDVKWYEKSPASDPVGPPSGLHRVIRGGTWFWVTSYACRSAYRMSLTPSFRAAYHGFRIVRVLDATKPETPGATIAKPGASPTMPTRPWNTPAFQLWVKAIQALTAEKQVEAVSKKLMELNQGFDGKLTPKVERGVVTECRFITNNVTDISPVRALVGLEILGCGGGGEGGGGWGKLSDLSPLQGMPLKELHCSYTQVSDLTPLEGMALRFVDCTATRTSDLSPLRGMPLARLNCASTQVADLSPLEGMKLATLNCTFTQIADLTPLDGMGLTNLRITPKNITRGWDVVRQMKTLKTISIGGAQNQQFQPAEFWKKYDAGEFGMPAAPAKLAYFDPTFQAWVKATQALPAGQQIEAVSRKLMELNPGFDGKVTGYDGKGLPKIENGAVREFGLFTDNVMDISPVRALVILKSLNCSGSGTGKGRLTDLSPLKGMSALLDLTCAKTQVSDLSPLQGMNLVTLHCPITPVSDLKPLERMKLSVLTCDETQVLDLSPLREVPLRHLYCYNTQISDLTPLAGVRTLSELRVNRTKVTPASVAALQQALPNCKIDWDDPAKPKTPQPSIQSIDLLKLIDPKQSFNGGIWSKGPNGMTSPNEEFEWALVRVPYVVPEEYDWRIVVERANDNPIVKPANNSGRSLALHFIASGNRGSVCIDGYHNGTCALEMVDKNMGPTFQGPIMKPGKPVALRVSVRKDSVSVAADDKEILSWHGDMGRFSSYARWAIPDRQNLFIGSQASFIIHEMSVTPVAEGKSSAASGTK